MHRFSNQAIHGISEPENAHLVGMQDGAVGVQDEKKDRQGIEKRLHPFQFSIDVSAILRFGVSHLRFQWARSLSMAPGQKGNWLPMKLWYS